MIGEQPIRRFSQLDPARLAVRFHARSRVHSIAPDVEDELATPDHTTDDGARIEADPELETAQTGAPPSELGRIIGSAPDIENAVEQAPHAQLMPNGSYSIDSG
jgi:hypothetical protein